MDPAEERERALDLAARALSRRDQSAGELEARLTQAGVRPRARAQAVRTLERLGYVDDERFAHQRAAHLAGRGLGDAAIRDDLERRGTDRGAVDAALGALTPERERAIDVAARLGGGLRAARTLGRRGFSEEVIESALRSDLDEE